VGQKGAYLLRKLCRSRDEIRCHTVTILHPHLTRKTAKISEGVASVCGTVPEGPGVVGTEGTSLEGGEAVDGCGDFCQLLLQERKCSRGKEGGGEAVHPEQQTSAISPPPV